MREILADIRSGGFAGHLSDEAAAGYPLLREAREKAAGLPVEQARIRLSRLFDA
jgi:ketol-acid reductoisomerase